MLGIGAASLASAGPVAAPAPDGAANGGPVIVVLKTQHSNMNERTHARALKVATHSEQAPVVAAINAAGGTHVLQLTEPNEVAATLSASAVASLRTNPAVASVIPDPQIDVAPNDSLTQSAAPASQSQSQSNNAAAGQCPFNPNPSQPLVEGESLTQVNATPAAMSIADGTGVVVANEGVDELAGNPNFIRPDGTAVVLNAPDPTADDSNDEFYGDASSIAAQGTVVYQYSGALPNATDPIPPNCTFVIRGDAPGASLLDLSMTPFSGTTQSLAQVEAGMDAAVTGGADVISESFGSNYVPGAAAQSFTQTDDAAVAAGVTVVASAGDAGDSGTMNAPAMDPNVIAASGTDSLRLISMDDGYQSFLSSNISAISSGGTAPTNKVADLAAPSWFGSEAACALGSGGCPTTYPTESMRGTSESAPLIAGGAADVIEAYRNTHNGASPTPAMVKSILTSTATDIDSPADQQGSGQLNILAAVRAAQEMPGTTLVSKGNQGNGSTAVVATPSQLDLEGDGGSTSTQSVSLYNTSSKKVSVDGSFRSIGPEFQIGNTVTENVSAPDPSLPVPEAGATAAPTIHFTVPKNVDRLSADMVWPDPTNANRLYYQVFNPQGALVQESYDDGTLPRTGTHPRPGTISNSQHVEIAAPQAGQWTVKFFWGGVDEDLSLPQPGPGTYTGTMSFRVEGADWITSPATSEVTIPAHSSVSVPVNVPFPTAPGDHPESIQFSSQGSGNIELASVPVARRTLIPSTGGSFQTVITSTVGRNQGNPQTGQLDTYKIDVPAGLSNLSVTFHASDSSPNNTITYYLVSPTGAVVSASTPNTTGTDPGTQTLTATAPVSGEWEIDVRLGESMSGNEFTETVDGNVSES